MAVFQARDFEPADAHATLSLTRIAIAELSPPNYSTEDIQTWLSTLPDLDTWRLRLGQALCCRLACREDQIIAFASITPAGHVDFIMCHPDWARRGIATRLVQELHNAAGHSGLTTLTTQASLTARPFFETCGYRIDQSRNVNGLACFGMIHRLDPSK